MKRSVAVLVVVFCAVGAGGCGGGGGGGSMSTPSPLPSSTSTPPPVPATVVPRVTLSWGERSRATGGLNSALSAVVRLQGAKADDSDLVFTVNRAASPGHYMITVNAPEAARVGQWPFSVTFFAEPEGAGAMVGVAQAAVDLPLDGTLPEVRLAATIAQVEMVAEQQVMVGQKRDLSWTARASDGALVPVTPGSGLFSIGSGADCLRLLDGQAEGLTPGMASVVVRVDGVSSAAMPVRISSNAVVTVTPNPSVVSINGNVDFTAQVSETANQSVAWSVMEVGSGSITAGGRYTAPAVAGVYAIQAISQYDPEKRATVTVTVQDGSLGVGGEFPPSGGIGVEID